jgi:RNA polymerase sigma-70 factor (ECF subfamily)
MIDLWTNGARVGDVEARLGAERPRLVRLCARLTGDAGAAEDLAQETLAEAWRLLERLRDPDGTGPWLRAIARNMCLRWMRERGREAPYAALALPNAEDVLDGVNCLPAEDDALSLALERGELALLLDRALALLPEETRAALVGRYVAELPQAELAVRLGLSEGALRVRLHRGRLALRRMLEGDLRDEAVDLGLVAPGAREAQQPEWRVTRIWCPFCAGHTLSYRVDAMTGHFTFRCPGACVIRDGTIASGIRRTGRLAKISSPKSILARHCLDLDGYYRAMLARGYETCDECDRRAEAKPRSPSFMPLDDHIPYGLFVRCPKCGADDTTTAWHLMLDTPEAQRFWRRHPRMRALPAREVEMDGRAALVTGFESADHAARLEIVSSRDTYKVLRVSGEEGGA